MFLLSIDKNMNKNVLDRKQSNIYNAGLDVNSRLKLETLCGKPTSSALFKKVLLEDFKEVAKE